MAKKGKTTDNESDASGSSTPIYQEEKKGHDFTRREYDVGLTFFWLLVIGIIILAFTFIWTIADLIAPTGKTEFFASLPFGVKFMVIGMFLFGFFMLFVMFTILYNRGTNALTRAIFSAEKMYRQTKATKEARVITAGLMISIIVIGLGILLAIVYSRPQASGGTSTGSAVLDFLSELWSTSFGEFFLLFAVLYFSFVVLIIMGAWIWNQGTIAIQKRFFIKNQ
jgi:hypothetical protein